MPFNFKVTLQEDQIETLEEDCVWTLINKTHSWMYVNKGEWWNKKHKADMAFPLDTHTHLPSPQLVPFWLIGDYLSDHFDLFAGAKAIFSTQRAACRLL